MSGVPPLISDLSRPFWDALAAHEIRIQRCDDCGTWVFYPRFFCTGCGGRALTWTRVEGAATLYSWTIAQVPVAKAFAPFDKPVLAVVELANGVRLPTTIEDVEPGGLTIGMALEPIFDSETYAEATLLRFCPA